MTNQTDPLDIDADLRARLNRLQALRAKHPTITTANTLAPLPPTLTNATRSAGRPQPIEALTVGALHETEFGNSYVIPTLYDADHRHGGRPLTDWLRQDMAGAAAFTRDGRLAHADPRRCAFLDTETTGLASSAGTLVFLVGIGRFTAGGFEVRQFFLRDPGEEPAMLRAIARHIDGCDALVTFNGRSFDVPLLSGRFTLNRQRVRLEAWSNLDLLHPARKLWKRRLESCRLAALESEVLGVERAGEDVPGALIPQMYQDYVRTGDGREMRRVIYHNLIDVLSMVTLAARLCETFANPHAARPALPADDLLSMGRWYEGLALFERAHAAYEAALGAARHDHEMAQVLEYLAGLLKKQNRRAEAAAHWETWCRLSPSAVEPRLELAMHHEWHTHDLDRARAYTAEALRMVHAAPRSSTRVAWLADLERRSERLSGKR